MNLRAGWTPRILGVVLALAVAWFVVAHADGFLPAIGQVAGLGPAALPIGLAIVAVGVLTRALQAHASFRLVELPARFGSMLNLSATSYATNKVVKSAGTAGLVPYLAHADRAGQSRAQVAAAYLVRQAGGDHVALLPDRRRRRRRGRDRRVARVRPLGRARLGGVRGRRRRRADPDRRPPVDGRSHRAPGAAGGVPLPQPVRPSAPRARRRVRRPRAVVCDGSPAGRPPCRDPPGRDRVRREAPRLRRPLHGPRRPGGPPRRRHDAARLHADAHGLAGRSHPGWRRRRRRLTGRLAHRQRRRRADRRGGRAGLPAARPLAPAPRGCRRRRPPVPAQPRRRRRRSCSSPRSWSASCRSRP